jgi:hypothetical protein
MHDVCLVLTELDGDDGVEARAHRGGSRGRRLRCREDTEARGDLLGGLDGPAGSRSVGTVEVAHDVGDVRDSILSTAATSRRLLGLEKGAR